MSDKVKFTILTKLGELAFGLPLARIGLIVQVEKSTLRHPSNQGLERINGKYLRSVGKILNHEGSLGFFRGASAFFASELQGFLFPYIAKFWGDVAVSLGLNEFIVQIGIGAFTTMSLYPLKFCYYEMCLDFRGKEYGMYYRGLKDCIQRNFESGGIITLYTGGFWHFLGEASKTLLTHFAGKILRKMNKNETNNAVMDLYLSLAVSLIVYPMSTLSKRMIATRLTHTRGQQSLLNKEMVDGLYDGFSIELVRLLSFGIANIVVMALNKA